MGKRPNRKRDQRAAANAPRPQNIVGNAQSAYLDAETGLRDLSRSARFGSADAMVAGAKALVVSGRQVVFLLRTLKRTPPFVDWLAPIEKEIDGDPLLSYFASLRDTIEKEGFPPVYATIDLHDADGPVGEAFVRMSADLHGLWTTGAVIGWDDPERVRLAVSANKAWLRHLFVEDPPESHLGRPVLTNRLDLLGRIYLDYLRERLINPAREILDAEPL